MQMHPIAAALLVGVLCGIAGYTLGDRDDCGPVTVLEKTDRIMR